MFNKEFVRFLLLGLFNSVWTCLLYLFLLRYLSYTLAFSVMFVCGVMVSYYFSSRFVFRVPLSLSKACRFPLVYLAQYCLGLLVLKVGVIFFSLSPRLAGLLVIFVSAPVTFLLSRLVLRPSR